MKGPGSRNNWKAGMIGIPIFLILLVLLVLAHDFWYVDMRCQSETGNFYSVNSLPERATALANLFRTQGWVVSGTCSEKAKTLFYSETLSEDERLILFDSTQVTESDLTTLVQGLYGQQIDADEVKVLLSAKRLVVQEEHTAALSEYNKVIDPNSPNFSLLYERAQLLNTLDWHEDTLLDLEQVVLAAQGANEPISDKIIEDSRALISQDSELASALAAASKEKYPTLNKIAPTSVAIATVVGTATVIITEAPSPMSSPTLLASPTIIMTPSSTAEPTLELSPTLSVTVTETIITPTIIIDATTLTSTVMIPVTASAIPTITATSPIVEFTPTVLPTSTPLVISTQPVVPTQIPTQIPTQVPTQIPTEIIQAPVATSALFAQTPTNTPFVPTNTSVPPTITPVPPTNTSVPPTNTSVPPTNTPVPPTNTSVPPTNTSVPPTNIPTLVPTNTFIPPSNTPTWIPSNTPTWVPTNTSIPPSNTPVSYPAPMLFSPENGVSISQNMLLQWSWNGMLQENEFFDVRVWREGEPAYGIGWTKDTSFLFDPASKGNGNYWWSVTVIRGENGEWLADLSPPAMERSLIISGLGGNSGIPTPPP